MARRSAGAVVSGDTTDSPDCNFGRVSKPGTTLVTEPETVAVAEIRPREKSVLDDSAPSSTATLIAARPSSPPGKYPRAGPVGRSFSAITRYSPGSSQNSL